MYCNTPYHYKFAIETMCIITSVNGSDIIRSLVCSPCDVIDRPPDNIEKSSINDVSNNVILREIRDMRNSMDTRLPKLTARIASNRQDILSLKYDVNSISNELKNKALHVPLASGNTDSIIDRLACETADSNGRNCNILLRNIPESKSKSLDERRRHDLHCTLDAFRPICHYNENQILITRVGSNASRFCRPICITLPSHDDALHALRNKSKVHFGYIASDFTP